MVSLAKWRSVPLQTKRLLIRIPLQSLFFHTQDSGGGKDVNKRNSASLNKLLTHNFYVSELQLMPGRTNLITLRNAKLPF